MKKFLLTAMAVVLTLGASALTHPFQKKGQIAPAASLEKVDFKKSTKEAPIKKVSPIKMDNIKKTPEGLKTIMKERLAKKAKAHKAPTFPPESINDLTGNYTWNYTYYNDSDGWLQDSEITDDLKTEQSANVAIRALDENTLRLTGMFEFPVTATYDSENEGYIINGAQNASYYEEKDEETGETTLQLTANVYGLIYFEGLKYTQEQADNYNEEHGFVEGDEGFVTTDNWYIEPGIYPIEDVYFYVTENGIVFDPDIQIAALVDEGEYSGAELIYPIMGSSTMAPNANLNGFLTLSDDTPDGITREFDFGVTLTQEDNTLILEGGFSEFFGISTNPVTIYLNSDKTFYVGYQDALFTYDNNVFRLFSFDGSSLGFFNGTGDNQTLQFVDWTCGFFNTNGSVSIMGQLPGGTIQLLEGAINWPAAYDVFVLGNLAGNDNTWAPNKGVQLTRDEQYIDDVYSGVLEFTKDVNSLKSFFGLTTALAENADDWNGIAQNRFGAETDQYWLNDNMMGTFRSAFAGTNSFAVTPGTYKIYAYVSDSEKAIRIDKIAPDDVYVLGNIDENEGLWEPNKGFKMTPDEDGVVYTAEININNKFDGFSTLSFTKQLGNDWNVIAPYRFGVDGSDEYLVTSLPSTLNMKQDAAGYNSIKLSNGKYTLELNINERTLVINGTFDYLLNYGAENSDWQYVKFVPQEDGSFVAADVEFGENTQFGVKYGPTWYAGNVGESSDDLYYIHSDWHTAPLASEGNIKNFTIEAAGTYTFTITNGENGLVLDVTGWPTALLVGDVDGDGKVDVSDINAVVNIILGKTTQADYPGNANIVEKDGEDPGKVDVSDLNAIVNIILGKSIE